MLALFALCAASFPAPAAARRIRPRFEPTDLDLEDPGMLEADVQLGVARGDDAWRVLVPDFELDLGINEYLEIDIDGTYAIEGRAGGPLTLDHPAPDNLWVGAKLGLYDSEAESKESAFALGVQLGPKLPLAPAAHGVGVETLALAGTRYRRAQLVWNAGGFIDPAPDHTTRTRPSGLELGVDGELDLDAKGRFSVLASTAWVHFVTGDDGDQLTLAVGATWSPIEALELSALGVVGVLAGGDRFVLLLGISPKLKLFSLS